MEPKELKLNDDWQYNNEEEAEMGQLQGIHNNMNAIAEVQRRLEEQAKTPSLSHCEECGDEIPEARRQAIRGCKLCVWCQEYNEKRK
jgi:phage/conjugal plasmid C-4 type zinc finger TraR family protein